jgi:Cof subfamily protein (haloacid dehalogenase superfamily)
MKFISGISVVHERNPMKTLYVADLDGTLFADGAVLTPKTIKILNRLIGRGLLFSVATARSVATVGTLLEDLDLTLPVSLMNGVFCNEIQTKRFMRHHPIDGASFQQAMQIFERHELYPFLYLFNGQGLDVQYTQFNNIASENFFEARRRLYYKTFYQVDALHIPPGREAVYINTLAEYGALKPLVDDFQAMDALKTAFYHDTYSDNWFFEIFSKQAGKGAGALALKELAGADRLVVFGDNYNDLPMFEAADECYAMGNAVDALKEAATGVIGTNNEDGVAMFLLEHFEG